jgi:hypothetical protein
MRLPKILFSYSYILVASILVIACWLLLWADARQKLVAGQHNAIWGESIYFRGYNPSTGEELTDQKVIAYATLLKRNRIKYAYIFAGPFDEHGNLPEFAFSATAIRTVKLLSEHYPDLIVLPWIGGIQDKTVRLHDPGWQRNAIQATKRMITTLQVKGAHLDFEFILPGNSYLDSTFEQERSGQEDAYPALVNEFHIDLRREIPDAFISAVVACSSTRAKQWKRRTTFLELIELVKFVDQVSFLFYDTSIRSQYEFNNACAEQLADINRLRDLTLPRKVEFLLAIGTFVNRIELQGYRNLKIESVRNTLETIRRMSSNSGGIDAVDGIAIFCDWETDQNEWLEFRNGWINQVPL